VNAYWLSRSGGALEGPIAEPQLRVMWGRGLFEAADLLRAEGSENWEPAIRVMDSMGAVVLPPPDLAVPLPPPPQLGGLAHSIAWKASLPEPERPPGVFAKFGVTLLGLAVVGSLLAILVVALMGPEIGGRPDVEQAARSAAQAWIKESRWGAHAEVFSLGPPLRWQGDALRVLLVRNPDGMGGGVYSRYVLKMSRSQQYVDFSWRPQEWLDLHADGAPPEVVDKIRLAASLEASNR
jgi:hypothetical protein